MSTKYASDTFLASIEIILHFFSFNLSIWHITFIGFLTLIHLCIPWIS